jgi:hypothetical protein
VKHLVALPYSAVERCVELHTCLIVTGYISDDSVLVLVHSCALTVSSTTDWRNSHRLATE